MNLKDIKLTWLGHATFRIETPAGKTVIIDPWIMGNPMCPDPEKKVKRVDILLCTHGHGDHIGTAPGNNFVLLVPAANDKNTAPMADHKAVADASIK